MSCRYASAVNAVGESIADAINSVDFHTLERAFPELPDNPCGAVVVVFCRECDCTHASVFSPDVEPANQRALEALCLAVATLSEESEAPHGQSISSEEATRIRH